MKMLRLALVALLLAAPAHAQQLPQASSGFVLGNDTAATRNARPASVSAILDRALGSTRGALISRGASGWVIISPSATAGLPFVSAGTGADPIYQLLGVVGGGTGQNSYTLGDLLYASGPTALSKLAGNITTTNQYLRQVGNGSVSAAPSWSTIPTTELTGAAALTKTDDTNVTLTLGGTPATSLLRAVSLTLGWTGQLAIARGGTSASTQQGFTNAAHNCPPTRAGDLIYYNGTNWVCLAGNNTGTRVLQEDASGVPSWVPAGVGTVTSVTLGAGYGISVSGTNPITGSGTFTPAVQLSFATNTLALNIALNNTANYFDGPSMPQGSTGLWYVTGTVTVQDTAGAANIDCKLWDGTTVLSSSRASIQAANLYQSISLSGTILSPAGNIRISCKDNASTSGLIVFNASGNATDSRVTGFRLQ